MTWSYSVSDLATSTRDQVRMLIGDTDTTDQQIQDEEIDQMIVFWGDAYVTAVACCDNLIAKYSRQADRSVGQMRLSASQRAKAYQELKASLRRQMAVGVGAPYAGGISVSDKQANEQDSDRVAPAFWTDMEKNPGNLSPSDEPIQDWNQ